MPIRSLHSSVLKWPDEHQVVGAFWKWAEQIARLHDNVVRIGYFGSYARGDWGVGSDLDIVILLDSSEDPFMHRASGFDLQDLPVPADVLVYTLEEWKSFRARQPGYENLYSEIKWML